MNKIIAFLISLKPQQKTVIQVFYDCFVILISYWLAFVIRLDGIGTSLSTQQWSAIFLTGTLTIFVYYKIGIYKSVVRFTPDVIVIKFIFGAFFSTFLLVLLSNFDLAFIPRSVTAIYFLLLCVLSFSARMSLRGLFLTSTTKQRAPVIIFGTGDAIFQALSILQSSKNFRAAYIVEHKKNIDRRNLNGIPVISENALPSILNRGNIRTCLVAVSNEDLEQRQNILKKCAALQVEIRLLPDVSEIISGQVTFSRLRKVSVIDILGRSPVPAVPELIQRSIVDKKIMITGAGGSIGGELCRKIIEHNPKKVVLFDSSEAALYKILEELKVRQQKSKSNFELVALLGSVTDRDLVRQTITSHKIECIYHAAAYKHVPIVEDNISAALKNNVFGTLNLAIEAGLHKVESFTLISSDKAVRPTNIMGATKRVCELIINEQANIHQDTKYCSVRFGNVLGSSGSVVPKFNQQIQDGGPITVTDPNITRYFMTISEATELVIQASALALSSKEALNTFLLDMGEPIKILELAQTMARLQGYKTYLLGLEPPIQNAISIEITGLRPGEKLYEELLINSESQKTDHSRIMKDTTQASVKPGTLQSSLDKLREAANQNNENLALQTLKAMNLDYNPNRPNI